MAVSGQTVNDIFEALRAQNAENAAWYRPQSSTNIEPAQNVCYKVLQSIHLLDLTKDELQLMKRHWTCDGLRKHIEDVRKTSDREAHGPAYEKARSFLYGVSRFAERTCDIVQMALPTGSEYSAALAVIALFARPFNVKADREDKILAQIDVITDLLPTFDYLRKALQTAPMMQAVSGICADIAIFLYEALCYYKKPRLEKLVSSLVSNYEDKFGNHVTSISRHVTTIRSLQSTALLALQLDASEKIDRTAMLLLEMHKTSELRAANVVAKIDECMSSVARQAETTAIIHAQNLSEALVANPLNVREHTTLIEFLRKDLPSTDLWENHGSEINISPWLQTFHRPLLWLGGPQRPGRISWVSSFTVDFLTALTLEPNIHVAAVFCASGVESYLVIKTLVDQILHMLPSLPLSSSSDFPIRRFRNVGKSTKLAFELIYDLLDSLESQPTLSGKGLFLIIDRVDLCSNTEDCNIKDSFIPALQQMAVRFAHLNIVVSSSQPAAECNALDQSAGLLTSVWVNTLKPMAMRQR